MGPPTVSVYMASVRKKLIGLLYATAKQSRSLPASWAARTISPISTSIDSPSPAHSCQFSSSPENNGGSEHPPSQSFFSRPPTLASAYLSLLSPHRSAHHFTPLAGVYISCSTRSPLFLSSPSSLLSQSATPFFCPRDVDLTWICRNVYIHDAKSRLQDDDPPHQQEAACENTRGHVHQHVEVKEECSTWQASPWNSDEVINWPNAISFGRLLSGPFLAWLIVQGLLQPALIGLVIAGASDWLDGYMARRKGIDSVVGTYLDPLADKVLIGCVALSMAHAGYLPSALVALVVVRDAALVGGSFIHRAHNLNWQLNSLRDFFNIADGQVQKVKPLFISKINTVFQLALVGTALVQPAFGIEDMNSLVPLLSWCVAFTTCASSVGYGWKLFQSRR